MARENRVEEVRLRVHALPTKGNGLSQTTAELQAIDRLLLGINAKLAGIHVPTTVVKNAQQIRRELDAAFGAKGLNVSRKPADLAKMLGLDAKAFGKFVAEQERQILEAVQRARGSGGAAGTARPTRLLNTKGEFAQRGFADAALAQFTRQQFEFQQQIRQGLATLFGPRVQTRIPVEQVQSAVAQGEVVLRVPAGQIAAVVEGMVRLVVPAGQITGIVEGAAGTGLTGGSGGSGGGVQTSRRGAASVQTPTGEPLSAGATPDEIKRVVARTKKGVQTTVERALGELGAVARTYGNEGELLKESATTRPGALLRRQMAERIAQVKAQAMAGIDTGFTGNKAADLRTQARVYRGAAGGLTLNEAEIRQLTEAGLGEMAGKATSAQGVFAGKALRAERAAILAETAEKEKQELSAKKQAAELERERVAELKAAGRSAKALAAQQGEAAKKAANYTSFWEKAQGGRAGQERLAGLEALGFKPEPGGMTRYQNDQPVSRRRVFTREQGGMREAITATEMFGKSGEVAAVQFSKVATAAKAAGQEAAHAGRNFLQNTMHVTAWAASVGLLYGSLNLLRGGLRAVIDTGLQTARLTQTFRGVGGSAVEVMDDTLALAAAQGVSSKEAEASAIAWSRMGLSRVEIQEAVKQSLMGANVAEMTAVETTEKLGGAMLAYGYRVEHLRGMLGELNQVSNTLKVTNKDLLNGLARSANVAKQAGLGYAELVGMIGAGVATTGQSGANIGNAIKTLVTRLGNPGLQGKLKANYQIEVRADESGIKNMPQILQELYLRYQELNNAERQHLLYQVGGATQSSRLAALLDSYVTAQVKAIQAQQNLSSAEKENALIKETLKNQLQGLATEWERFAVQQGNRGLAKGLSEITVAFRNLGTLLNTPGGSWAATGFGVFLTVIGAKLALTALGMRKVGVEAGLVGRTIDGVKTAWAGLQGASMRAIQSSGLTLPGERGIMPARRLGSIGERIRERGRTQMNEMLFQYQPTGVVMDGKWKKEIVAVTAAQQRWNLVAGASRIVWGNIVQSVGLFIAALPSLAIWMAVIVGGVWAWNAAAEKLGFSSEAAAKKVSMFSTQASEAAAAADAAGQSVRFYDTALGMLGKRGVPKNFGEWTKGIADIAYPEELGKGPKSDALRTRLAALEAANGGKGDKAGLEAEIKALRSSGIESIRTERQKEYGFKRNQIETLQADIARVERSWPPTEGKKQSVANKKEQMRRLSGEATGIQNQIVAADDEFVQRDRDHLATLETIKGVMEAISNVYRDMPSATPMDKWASEMGAMKAQLTFLETAEAKMTESDKGVFESREHVKEETARIDVEIRRQQEIIRTAGLVAARANEQAANYGLGGASAILTVTDPANQKINELLKEREGLKTFKGTTQLFEDAAHKKVEDDKRDLKAKMEAAEERKGFARYETQKFVAREGAKSDITAQEIGENPTAQLLSKKAGLQRLLSASDNELTNLNFKQDQGLDVSLKKQNLIARTQKYLNELRETELGLLTRRGELEKDYVNTQLRLKKEQDKRVLTGGAGDLLQQYAAQTMAAKNPGGMGAAGWFGLSADMRRLLHDGPNGQFNPDLQEIKKQQNMLKGQPGVEGVQARLERLTAMEEKWTAQVNSGMAEQYKYINLHSQALGVLTTKTADAAAAMGKIPEVVAQIAKVEVGKAIAASKGSGVKNAANPRD